MTRDTVLKWNVRGGYYDKKRNDPSSHPNKKLASGKMSTFGTAKSIGSIYLTFYCTRYGKSLSNFVVLGVPEKKLIPLNIVTCWQPVPYSTSWKWRWHLKIRYQDMWKSFVMMNVPLTPTTMACALMIAVVGHFHATERLGGLFSSATCASSTLFGNSRFFSSSFFGWKSAWQVASTLSTSSRASFQSREKPLFLSLHHHRSPLFYPRVDSGL